MVFVRVKFSFSMLQVLKIWYFLHLIELNPTVDGWVIGPTVNLPCRMRRIRGDRSRWQRGYGVRLRRRRMWPLQSRAGIIKIGEFFIIFFILFRTFRIIHKIRFKTFEGGGGLLVVNWEKARLANRVASLPRSWYGAPSFPQITLLLPTCLLKLLKNVWNCNVFNQIAVTWKISLDLTDLVIFIEDAFQFKVLKISKY